MRFTTTIAAILSVFVAADVHGQARQSQVDDIRRQIDVLQRQLNSIEPAQALSTQRVTQLGGIRPQRGNPSIIVRVYDLSDLFSISPAYTAAIGNDLGLTPRPLFPEAAVSHPDGGAGMGGIGGGMGGMFNVSHEPLLAQASNARGAAHSGASSDVAASAKTTMNSLVNSITSTIEPDSWEELSGPGSISRLGTSLIIRNEAGIHEQIDALFMLLRKKWGTLRTVSISAWWLPLTDQQMAKLLPGNGKGKTGVEGIEAFGVVDDAAWSEFTGRPAQVEKNAVAAYRAIITCYNGQTVNTISGSEDGIVNDIEPVVTRGANNQPEGRVAYHPVLTPIHEGSALQITPLVSASGTFVMLDVHSCISVREPAAVAKRQAVRDDEPGPAAVIGSLDRPRLITQRLATTLRAPIDRVMLVGGMPLSAKPQGDEPTLYLFLRTTVQELRDEIRKPAPVENRAQPPEDESVEKEPAR